MNFQLTLSEVPCSNVIPRGVIIVLKTLPDLWREQNITEELDFRNFSVLINNIIKKHFKN